MNKQQLTLAAYHLKLGEVKKIIHATNSYRDRCLVKALFWTGLRKEEAIKLDIRDIDFERKRIEHEAQRRTLSKWAEHENKACKRSRDDISKKESLRVSGFSAFN